VKSTTPLDADISFLVGGFTALWENCSDVWLDLKKLKISSRFSLRAVVVVWDTKEIVLFCFEMATALLASSAPSPSPWAPSSSASSFLPASSSAAGLIVFLEDEDPNLKVLFSPPLLFISFHPR
jgi:hypothetical protein